MPGAPLARPTDAPPTAHQPAHAPAVAVPSAPTPVEPLLPEEELPRHVAIIMDGNRRWARRHGLTELDGHAAGVEAIRALRRGGMVGLLVCSGSEEQAALVEMADVLVHGPDGVMELLHQLAVDASEAAASDGGRGR